MSISKDEKKEKFIQTIVFIRKENKNFLRSAAALQDKAMYEFLDELLTVHRARYLKNTINQTNETNQKLE